MTRADGSHAPLVSAFSKAPLSINRFAACQTLYPSFMARTTGYLIPFTPLAFVSHCRCQPNRVLSLLGFFPISMHFTAPPEISFAPTVLQLGIFHRLSRIEPWDLTADLKIHLHTLYTQSFLIILASFVLLHCFFSEKRSSRAMGLLPPRDIALSGFLTLWRILTTAFCRSLGHVSVPMWLIILSDQLLIIALTRAPPRADSSFCSSIYGVLVVVSNFCSPPKGRFLRVTHLSSTRNTIFRVSRPTCITITDMKIMVKIKLNCQLPQSKIGLLTDFKGTGVKSLYHSRVLMRFHASLRPRKMDKFLFLGTHTRFVTTKG
ncbi:hypothetical protein H5410_030694 [Solanum commersonii]|uniref:Uncharacterized protein n=1 Tax=Solanum commersonii TaxID=4109 RepID=A0A9J5YJG4_SOLCO|nr:hypothetical protein H5410_030694 [Solanum commersonii]